MEELDHEVTSLEASTQLSHPKHWNAQLSCHLHQNQAEEPSTKLISKRPSMSEDHGNPPNQQLTNCQLNQLDAFQPVQFPSMPKRQDLVQ